MQPRKPIQRVLRGIKDFFGTDELSALPWIGALKRYDRPKFFADIKAAMSVALLAIPQGIAYAAIAGLPIVYGIISSAVAAIVAPFFASSRHTILGPTNATAFMMFSFFAAAPELAARQVELVTLVALMVGIFCIIGALLRVADFLQFISRSVLVGYIAGAAVLIIVNQLSHVVGIKLSTEETRTFFGQVWALGSHISQSHWQPMVTAASTLLSYFLLKKYKPKYPNFAIVLLLSSLIWGSLSYYHVGPFGVLKRYESFTLHELLPSVPHFFQGNFFENVSALFGVAFALAFLASLENTIMAKTLAARTGESCQVNQDMLAVGAANIAVSLAGGMTVSGSLLRSTLNIAAGARTRFCSVFCGIFTLGVAVLFAIGSERGFPVLDFIPQAAMAALIISVGFSLFNLQNIRVCLRSTPDDAAVLIATFAATLITPLHTAIFVGVAISIILFLRKASRPEMIEYDASDSGELSEHNPKNQRANPSVSIVHVEGDLFFGAADLFRSQIQQITADPSLKVIILRLKNARHLDATAVMALSELVQFVRNQKRHILISGCSRAVYRVLKNSGVIDLIQEDTDRSKGESNVFPEMPKNATLATRGAIKRAQQILGTDKADVRIFVESANVTKNAN